MYELCNLNKYNLAEFKKLESLKHKFNNLNRDLWNEYYKLNKFLQYLMCKKIKLLKYDNCYVGYIWIEKKGPYICTIKSMYILETMDLIKSYSYLINSIKGCTRITYDCEKNYYNFSLLRDIGFEINKSTIDMEISLKDYTLINVPRNIHFQRVTIGKDEKLRCALQNQIFNSKDRIPLKIDDIYYDEIQDYYCEDGAIFLKLDKEYIGYGQIIMRHKQPYIVNFGILPTYRNNGYGKLLLIYLLNIIYSKGKSKAKIKVDANNSSALNLYKSVEFREVSEDAKWFLKS